MTCNLRPNVQGIQHAEIHQKIYDTYTLGIHGSALLQEDSLMYSTDCTSSQYPRSRTQQFRVGTPECADCHANEQLMEKCLTV
jgi:hypothetical protein